MQLLVRHPKWAKKGGRACVRVVWHRGDGVSVDQVVTMPKSEDVNDNDAVDFEPINVTISIEE